MTPTYSLFMRQSYLDAWEDFNRSLVREDFPRWDYVVLTASNEAQAEAFRLQLEARREQEVSRPVMKRICCRMFRR